MSMHDALNESIFEFAFSIQNLIKCGWKLKEIEYGDHRFGIRPSLIATKDNEEKKFYCVNDVDSFLFELTEAEDKEKYGY